MRNEANKLACARKTRTRKRARARKTKHEFIGLNVILIFGHGHVYEQGDGQVFFGQGLLMRLSHLQVLENADDNRQVRL